MDSIIQYINDYFWQGMALLVSPLVGYCVAQWYKQPGITPSRHIRAVAGLSTAIVAFMAWVEAYPGMYSAAVTVALIMGCVQPLMIWIWYQVAKRFSPDSAKAFANSGEGDDRTFLPFATTRFRKKK